MSTVEAADRNGWVAREISRSVIKHQSEQTAIEKHHKIADGLAQSEINDDCLVDELVSLFELPVLSAGIGEIDSKRNDEKVSCKIN